MIRRPAVAGTFYPADADALRRQLARCLKPSTAKPAKAVLGPHAGYEYSGPVAGAVYASVIVPDDVVLLSFNHRGRGAEFAVWPKGAWRTPLGDAPIADDLASHVSEACKLEDDPEAFAGEHSGEVHVPFLQARNPGVRIVPVALSCGWEGFDALTEFGKRLAAVEGAFLVAASTDMSHFEPDAPTRVKDKYALDAISELDAPALRDAVRRHDISMCGFAPTVAFIAYAKARGAKSARLVVYGTSADTSGDYDRVVGYAGFVVD